MIAAPSSSAVTSTTPSTSISVNPARAAFARPLGSIARSSRSPCARRPVGFGRPPISFWSSGGAARRTFSTSSSRLPVSSLPPRPPGREQLCERGGVERERGALDVVRLAGLVPLHHHRDLAHAALRRARRGAARAPSDRCCARSPCTAARAAARARRSGSTLELTRNGGSSLSMQAVLERLAGASSVSIVVSSRSAISSASARRRSLPSERRPRIAALASTV